MLIFPPNPPREWVVDGLLPNARVTLVCASEGACPTTLLRALASSCSTGEPFLDLPCAHLGPMLMVAGSYATGFEVSVVEKGRTRALDRISGEALAEVGWRAYYDRLLDHVEVCGCEGVIVDGVLGEGPYLIDRWSERAQAVSEVLHPINMSRKPGLTVLATVRLTGEGPGRMTAAVASRWGKVSGADACLHVRLRGPAGNGVLRIDARGPGPGWATGVLYEVQPNGTLSRLSRRPRMRLPEADDDPDAQEIVLEAIRAMPGSTAEALQRRLRWRRGYLLSVVRSLIGTGKIVNRGKAGPGRPWCLYVPDAAPPLRSSGTA